MKTIREVTNGPAISNYSGSEATYNMVAEQIRERWGESEVEHYDPYSNALTFAQWLKLGYRVKKGEKALKSITFIESTDENGGVLKRIKRSISLFFYKQVEKIETES